MGLCRRLRRHGLGGLVNGIGQKHGVGSVAQVVLQTLTLDVVEVVQGQEWTVNILGRRPGSTLAFETGAPPTGMTLNSAAGTISGTPANIETADFSLSESLAGASNTPNITADLSVGVIAAPDVTAPVLTNPLDAKNGTAAMTGSVDTDEANGTLYWFISTSATPPSTANLKAAIGAVAAGSQAVSATGTQAISDSGLSAATAYFTHFLHTDAAGNDSAIVTASGFTTDSATSAPSITSPMIMGAATDGSTLSAMATVNGNPTPTVTYQWQVNGVNISGATGMSLVLDFTGQSITAGDTISVEITATNSEGSASAEPTKVASAGGIPQPTLGFTSASGSEPLFEITDLIPDDVVTYDWEFQVGGDSGFTTGPGAEGTIRSHQRMITYDDFNTALAPFGTILDNLPPDVQIYYRVRIVDDQGGAGPWSNTVNDLIYSYTADPFIFTDVTDATQSTVYTSNTITVNITGTAPTVPISITGGEYRVNGGSWTSASGNVADADTVDVRGTSSASYATDVDVVLTIANQSDTYTITTIADPTDVQVTLLSGDEATNAQTSGTTHTFTNMACGAGEMLIYVGSPGRDVTTVAVAGLGNATFVATTDPTSRWLSVYRINGGGTAQARNVTITTSLSTFELNVQIFESSNGDLVNATHQTSIWSGNPDVDKTVSGPNGEAHLGVALMEFDTNPAGEGDWLAPATRIGADLRVSAPFAVQKAAVQYGSGTMQHANTERAAMIITTIPSL